MAKAEYRSAVRSRKMIVNALVDLLQEKSLDKITITDVVNRAQLNRGTFYAHYVSIEDVLQQMIWQTFLPIQNALSKDQVCLENVAETLLKQIQEIIESDLLFFQKVSQSNASTYIYKHLISAVEEYMLQHEQDYAFGKHEDFVFLIRFCAGGLSNLYQDWFAGKLNISLDALTLRATVLLNKVILYLH